ncbi:MAG: AI-2E family transporter [Oligoflexia bacterium]|nr:AI-2E family transporter [Oligoflexia bacterium]
MLMGGIFAVLLVPLLERLEARKVPTALASALLTVGITLLFIIPASLLLYLSIRTGLQQVQALRNAPKPDVDWVHSFAESPFATRLLDWLKDLYPITSEELVVSLQDLIASTSLRAADLLGGFFLNLPSVVMAMVVVIVSLYFFLVDGRRLVLFFRRNSIFSTRQTDQLIDRLETSCRSVLLASIVSGIAQAFFFAVLAALARIPNVPLIGALVFFSSFIPVVGTAPVTLGVALHQLLVGNSVGLIAALVGAGVVTMMDNFIRPWFLRGTVNLHPLLAFVAAFGGLQTLGFVGVFLGPIIAALFMAILQIFTEPESEPTRIAPPPAGPGAS